MAQCFRGFSLWLLSPEQNWHAEELVERAWYSKSAQLMKIRKERAEAEMERQRPGTEYIRLVHLFLSPVSVS